MAENLIALFLIAFVIDVQAVQDEYYPRYHLAPPHGWMNGPSGFNLYHGRYHIFYPYNPESSHTPGTAHWGHASSIDLFHWIHDPIALFPKQDYDKNGVFSGSAFNENGLMYVYYTGNVNHPNKDPDYEQSQALATSNDGGYFHKYPGNPIIRADKHQPHIRDPKVWKHEDKYYMVLGNSFENNTLGRALLYVSTDKTTWKQVSVLHESDGSLGCMYECPDFFELDGSFVLLFSPQGIKPQGDKYRNIYQTGYIVGNFSYDTNKFEPLTDFQKLDHGHDFYATQTMLDYSDRRLMVAWLDTREKNYMERIHGFMGQMTIVRRLTLTKNNKLVQIPVREVARSRGDLLHYGLALTGTTIQLTDKAGEVKIASKLGEDLHVIIKGSKGASVTVYFSNATGLVTLDRGGDDGIRRTNWRPTWGVPRFLIYIDASSIEVFCGFGEVTFSSRFFPEGPIEVRVGNTSASEFRVTTMMRTMPRPL